MPFPVRLAPYDPEWPLAFAREKAALELALADLGDVVEIAHAGSTAVPGLVAKPVIDVLVGVTSVRPGDAYAERLAPLGYAWKRGAFTPRERELFLRRDGPEGVHVHLVPHGGQEWCRELAFRDALRENAALRDAYVALKRKLAAEHPEDGDAYANAKTPFLERVVGALR